MPGATVATTVTGVPPEEAATTLPLASVTRSVIAEARLKLSDALSVPAPVATEYDRAAVLPLSDPLKVDVVALGDGVAVAVGAGVGELVGVAVAVGLGDGAGGAPNAATAAAASTRPSATTDPMSVALDWIAAVMLVADAVGSVAASRPASPLTTGVAADVPQNAVV